MTSKAIVRELLDALPDDLSLLEIAREIRFLAGVYKGLREAELGEFLNADELRSQVQHWSKRI